ncbi:MAG TPA: 4,5-DOPA dioxygenase extradiol [Terriglobia bacterium]|nr:4,5-DOPA dioxygenase extradiol [Terriglobia bacterium]
MSEHYARRTFIGGMLGATTLAAASSSRVTMPLESTLNQLTAAPDTDAMPALFVGHGTPMSAIQPNQWTSVWAEIGRRLPRPRAILSISAHWLTQGGSLVTVSEAPHMNYDMYGFPQPIYDIVYPAKGAPALAREVSEALTPALPVYGDKAWGFDHGTWVVLKYMFPAADVPVIQLSIDYSKPPEFHLELGRRLAFLRRKGVLIIGSGNMVHNLQWRPGSNHDQPFDWAVEFDRTIWERIQEGDYQAVAAFQKLGSMAAMSHPTYDHFLPLLYCLGLVTARDSVDAFVESFQWPAVSMRSLRIA